MDLLTSLNQIPSGIYSLLGVVVGFGLNYIKDYYSNRAKLYYSLQTEAPYDDWSYEKYAKTPKEGSSGYIILIYNCGKSRVLINDVRLKWKDKLIDALILTPVTILPYHNYRCELSKQDYEVLVRWVEQNPDITEVEVVAYTMNGDTIKGILDISFIAMQTQLNFTNSIK